MTFGPKLAIAAAAGELARRAGRGGGTSLPGKLLLRMDREAIGRLAADLPRGSAAISATNGKTTTAAMVAGVLERRGERVVHNHAGANMAGGVASALLAATSSNGRVQGSRGLFEVDEFWLGQVVEQIEPTALALGNLFRDQLDRYGELETIAERWAAVVAARAGRTRLVLNADDPLIADLGRDLPGVLYYGVEDDGLALGALPHAADSKHCRRCGHAYAYDAVYLGHLGRYHCPACGAHRPRPQLVASDVRLDRLRGSTFTLRAGSVETTVALPLPGLYNVYNALAAAGLCLALDVGLAEAADGLGKASAAFGRAELIDVGGVPVSILLIKNPAGANEVLRTLALEDGELDLFCALNDKLADGRDVSWVWDADFDLLAGRVRRLVCSGTRAAELALRLHYAGVPRERIAVVPQLADGLDAALAGTPPGRTLCTLPTYTAMLELRGLLTDRGHVARYWA